MSNDVTFFFETAQEFILGVNSGRITYSQKEIIGLLKKDKNYQVGLLYHCYNKNRFGYYKTINSLIEFDISLSKCVEFAFEAIKYDAELIELFPQINTHPRLKLAVLAKSPKSFQQYQDWQNERKAILAIQFNSLVYRYLPENLKKNEKVIISALSQHIFYPELDKDEKYGIFFDLPTEYQQNKKIIKCAVKHYPAIFNKLPSQYRKDDEIVLAVLKKGFYEKDVSAFYHLQEVVPYVEKEFYQSVENIQWMMKGFEKNVENASMYTDCTILIFCSFMRASSKIHQNLKEFFEQMNIKERFENMLKKHQFKLYSDDLNPTGVEPEANEFFEEIFPNLSKNFEHFILMNQLKKDLSINPIELITNKV